MTLFDLVLDAYYNALDNEYDIDNMKPEELALDMQAYDSELEQYSTDAIMEQIIEVRKIL